MRKPCIRICFPDQTEGKLKINDFKALVIKDLMDFVFKQDPNEERDEEGWVEEYCRFLEIKE